MRYTQSIKDHVRNLRKEGKSLLQISKATNIPVTTITTWIKDISLSLQQRERLRIKVQTALQAGRIRTQSKNKKLRIKKEEKLFLQGKNQLEYLTKKELFIAGIALYWGEGFKNKHEHRLGFCNSDPYMILFYIYWLEKSLGITKDQLIGRLTLNESYKQQTRIIERYWSDLTGIPLKQFTKPFYQRVKWLKHYETNNYKGVLRIHVKDSLDFLLQMRGWIEGLKAYVQ